MILNFKSAISVAQIRTILELHVIMTLLFHSSKNKSSLYVTFVLMWSKLKLIVRRNTIYAMLFNLSNKIVQMYVVWVRYDMGQVPVLWYWHQVWDQYQDVASYSSDISTMKWNVFVPRIRTSYINDFNTIHWKSIDIFASSIWSLIVEMLQQIRHQQQI